MIYLHGDELGITICCLKCKYFFFDELFSLYCCKHDNPKRYKNYSYGNTYCDRIEGELNEDNESDKYGENK